MNNDNIFKVLKRYTEKAPVNLDALCGEIGLKIRYERLDDNTSGSIEKSGQGLRDFVISVNDTDPMSRQRFTIAHELGHFVLHRSKIGDGIKDNRLYRNHKGRANTGVTDRMETEANRFAANLLMPVSYIKNHAGDSSLDDMARNLMVSKEALRIRLGSLKKSGVIAAFIS